MPKIYWKRRMPAGSVNTSSPDVTAITFVPPNKRVWNPNRIQRYFHANTIPLFLLFGAQKWPPHHVSELFKSVMEIAWRLWCPVLPAYSENSESFKQKSNAGLLRFPPVKWSLRDNKDAQDKSESKSMPLELNFISLRSKSANSKHCL